MRRDKEFEKLLKYCEENSIVVTFVDSRRLHDYAAMNPDAAKAMEFHHIKPNEIEIDRTMPEETQCRNLKHELIELRLMNEGKGYWESHREALRGEKAYIWAFEKCQSGSHIIKTTTHNTKCISTNPGTKDAIVHSSPGYIFQHSIQPKHVAVSSPKTAAYDQKDDKFVRECPTYFLGRKNNLDQEYKKHQYLNAICPVHAKAHKAASILCRKIDCVSIIYLYLMHTYRLCIFCRATPGLLKLYLHYPWIFSMIPSYDLTKNYNNTLPSCKVTFICFPGIFMNSAPSSKSSSSHALNRGFQSAAL